MQNNYIVKKNQPNVIIFATLMPMKILCQMTIKLSICPKKYHSTVWKNVSLWRKKERNILELNYRVILTIKNQWLVCSETVTEEFNHTAAIVVRQDQSH